MVIVGVLRLMGRPRLRVFTKHVGVDLSLDEYDRIAKVRRDHGVSYRALLLDAIKKYEK